MFKIKGKLDTIIYRKDKFAIFTIKPTKYLSEERPQLSPYGNVKIKGELLINKKGTEFIVVLDKEEYHEVYGYSYSLVSLNKQFNPKNKKELLEYFKLLTGEKIASEMIKNNLSYEWIKNRDVKNLKTIKGIGDATVETILDRAYAFEDNSEAFVKLRPYGISDNLITKICKKLGGSINAVNACLNNPYELIDKVEGIGFKTADSIAFKVGIPKDSTFRIRAAIISILKEQGEQGKTFISANQLLSCVKKIADVEFQKIDSLIAELVKNKIVEISFSGEEVALKEYVDLEKAISVELKRINNNDFSLVKPPKDSMKILKEVEKEQGWEFNSEQTNAILNSLKNNLSVIYGRAGTGKTSVAKAICTILEDYHIKMCCLSAKAAQRLQEVTGMESSTIHRLLGLGNINIKSKNALANCEILIVDEASMISGSIFLALLKAIPSGCKLIILGDDGQLTAIGNCAVFSDILKAPKIIKTQLVKIHRQAQKSAIITESNNIRNQIPIFSNDFLGHKILGELQDLELFIQDEEESVFHEGLLSVVVDVFQKQQAKVKDILEVQIISVVKSRGQLSTESINTIIQNLFIPESMRDVCMLGHKNSVIYVGDKVINSKNCYNTLDVDGNETPVFNGSIGIVKKINSDDVIIDFVGIGEVVITQDLFENIRLAYSITCHSAQGSQWKSVIVAFDMSAFILLNVELLYTALTRASKHCILATTYSAYLRAFRTVEQNNKQTLLKELLN